MLTKQSLEKKIGNTKNAFHSRSYDTNGLEGTWRYIINERKLADHKPFLAKKSKFEIKQSFKNVFTNNKFCIFLLVKQESSSRFQLLTSSYQKLKKTKSWYKQAHTLNQNPQRLTWIKCLKDRNFISIFVQFNTNKQNKHWTISISIFRPRHQVLFHFVGKKEH